jgi:hypothetical protein
MSVNPHDYTRIGSTMSYDGRQAAESRGAWSGWLVFASLMMAAIGLVHLGTGFIALFQEDYYTVSPKGLAVSTNFTSWGWTQIGVGAVVLLAGIFLLRGRLWARIVTVIVAMLSIVLDFVFLPVTPFWSAMSITLTVISIYAVLVHGGDADLLD